MSAPRALVVTGFIAVIAGIGGLYSLKPAFADYYNGDYGSYGNQYGGTYGGYSNSYGGGYGSGYGGNSGSSAIISLELNEKASLNSGLRVAAREDRLNDLERLIAHGGDVNAKSDAGDTALIYASRNCSTKIVQYLLKLKNSDGSMKVNVNIKDRLGRTALMYAAADSCAPVVKKLLEVPNVEIAGKDRDGRSIRDYALDGAYLEMGGPAAETYALIRAAERIRMRARIAKNTASRKSTRRS